jgi:hypothetical protein
VAKARAQKVLKASSKKISVAGSFQIIEGHVLRNLCHAEGTANKG